MARRILNGAEAVQETELSWKPVEVATNLQKKMLQLKAQFISDDGRSVDYDGLRKSDAFKDYVRNCQQLHHLDLTKLSLIEKKSFFINIYNCLTIHGLADCDQLPSSVLDVNKFWANTCYNIGGFIFSLDDMEHGILRGNKPHPSVSHEQKHHFSENDPRAALALPLVDPRIHFALVCGAKSCPAIQVYTSRNVELALENATKSFISQEVEIQGSEVTISKILEWYASDFGADEVELLRWISNYLPDDDSKQQLLQLLSNNPKAITMISKQYNWTLNC